MELIRDSEVRVFKRCHQYTIPSYILIVGIERGRASTTERIPRVEPERASPGIIIVSQAALTGESHSETKKGRRKMPDWSSKATKVERPQFFSTRTSSRPAVEEGANHPSALQRFPEQEARSPSGVPDVKAPYEPSLTATFYIDPTILTRRLLRMHRQASNFFSEMTTSQHHLVY